MASLRLSKTRPRHAAPGRTRFTDPAKPSLRGRLVAALRSLALDRDDVPAAPRLNVIPYLPPGDMPAELIERTYGGLTGYRSISQGPQFGPNDYWSNPAWSLRSPRSLPLELDSYEWLYGPYGAPGKDENAC